MPRPLVSTGLTATIQPSRRMFEADGRMPRLRRPVLLEGMVSDYVPINAGYRLEPTTAQMILAKEEEAPELLLTYQRKPAPPPVVAYEPPSAEVSPPPTIPPPPPAPADEYAPPTDEGFLPVPEPAEKPAWYWPAVGVAAAVSVLTLGWLIGRKRRR